MLSGQLCLDSSEVSSATAMDPVSLQVGPAPHYQQWCHLQAPVEVRDPSILLQPQCKRDSLKRNVLAMFTDEL